MSATDELRRLLDERGVEWWQSANTLGCIFTRWYSPLFGDEVCAMENGEEGLVLFNHFMTPEQAIAATLGSCSDSCNCTNSERTDLDAATLGDIDATGGRQGDAGMCRITDNGPWGYPYVCSECGASFDIDVRGGEFNYCPNCGARCVG